MWVQASVGASSAPPGRFEVGPVLGDGRNLARRQDACGQAEPGSSFVAQAHFNAIDRAPLGLVAQELEHGPPTPNEPRFHESALA